MSEKLLYCDYCGEELGVGVRGWKERLSCGRRECENMCRDEEMQERDEAHYRLDQENGWS